MFGTEGFVIKTQKKLFEVKPTNIGKTTFLIRDYSLGNGDKIKDIIAYLDEADAELLAHSILFNTVDMEKKDSYGNIPLHFSQKIHSHKSPDADGYKPVITVKVQKNGPSMRIPYKVEIQIGKAKPKMASNGGVSIQSGTYKKLDDANFMISEVDMLRLCKSMWNHYTTNPSYDSEGLTKELSEYLGDEKKAKQLVAIYEGVTSFRQGFKTSLEKFKKTS